MNEKVKELINAVGMLTEIYMIAYKGFKNQGMSDKDAMLHNREFMTAFTSAMISAPRNQEGDEHD